ncbi:MAG: phosphotransferase [Proteobacteria bacterium]|nr:phosphotransferase [Pseudomonadota bacterium]
MIDIADKATLETYLLEKGLVNTEDGYTIEYMSGGVSGTVAFVTSGDKPMIVKQALAQLKVKETWLCDPNRMHIEKLSNEIYYKHVPESVPKVYFYDDENYIFGREAAPEHCTMWKSDLLDGLLDFKVAELAIDALVTVHNKCAQDAYVSEAFASKDVFYNLRISPYIEFTVEKYPQLAEYAKPIIEELMESAITLIHGDFSPKNILVDNRKIFVLDFEVAHYGHPSFDLAFFSNHFLLKAVKNKAYGQAYLNMLKDMLDIYFEKMNYMDKKSLEQSFISLLALMQLARVDGKSPAEYITSEEDKEMVRSIGFGIIDSKIKTIDEVIDFVLHIIKNTR